MREDLLGYLLGALEGDERERVEREIERNPALESEISVLQAQLDPLRETTVDYEPPVGLATRTCALIEQYRETTDATVEPVGLKEGTVQLQARNSFRWYDMVVGACVLIVGFALIFPAIVRSRHMAQRAACERNLQQLALALQSYSERANGYFPAIPLKGNRAFAGVFAPMLVENELVEQPGVFVCPSSKLASGDSDWQMPSLEEIDQNKGRSLAQAREAASGSYGYNLGVGVDGQYQPPKNRNREFFALVADSPTIHLPDRRSMNHGSHGQNVLYEDGHIVFVSGLADQYADHPFLSRRGNVEPGLDADDAVIGRSGTPPVAFIKN